ncbi:MAG TPA: AMP-dependent synthetase, partial [Burkholderiales bacterium]
MLQKAQSYEAVRSAFNWAIPAFYNIGVDICDKWADDPERLALIYEKRDGSSMRYSFADLRRLSNQAANLFASR